MSYHTNESPSDSSVNRPRRPGLGKSSVSAGLTHFSNSATSSLPTPTQALKGILTDLMYKYPHLHESEILKAVNHIRETFTLLVRLDRNLRNSISVEEDLSLVMTIRHIKESSSLGFKELMYLRLIEDALLSGSYLQSHGSGTARQSLWPQSVPGLGHSGPSEVSMSSRARRAVSSFSSYRGQRHSKHRGQARSGADTSPGALGYSQAGVSISTRPQSYDPALGWDRWTATDPRWLETSRRNSLFKHPEHTTLEKLKMNYKSFKTSLKEISEEVLSFIKENLNGRRPS